MTFDHMRMALLRLMVSKDEQIDREISQRLYEMDQYEAVHREYEEGRRIHNFARGIYPVPPMAESYQRSVRRLWRQPCEPLVSAETAAYLEELYRQ